MPPTLDRLLGGSLPSDWEVARENITTPVRTGFLQLKPVSPPSDRLLQVGAMSPTSGGGLLGVGHVSRTSPGIRTGHPYGSWALFFPPVCRMGPAQGVA